MIQTREDALFRIVARTNSIGDVVMGDQEGRRDITWNDRAIIARILRQGGWVQGPRIYVVSHVVVAAAVESDK